MVGRATDLACNIAVLAAVVAAVAFVGIVDGVPSSSNHCAACLRSRRCCHGCKSVDKTPRERERLEMERPTFFSSGWDAVDFPANVRLYPHVNGVRQMLGGHATFDVHNPLRNPRKYRIKGSIGHTCVDKVDQIVGIPLNHEHLS